MRLREAELDAAAAAQQLVKEGSSRRAELDAAEAEVDSLKARIAMAQQQVEVAAAPGRRCARPSSTDTVVRAPFAGVAISKDAQPGEMISPVSAGGGFTRTGICTIVDMTSLEIEVDVNESYINRVKPGAAGRGAARRLSRLADSGAGDRDDPTADRQKATVKVRIGFDQLDPRILPDMGVKVSFLAKQPRAGLGERRGAAAAAGAEGGGSHGGRDDDRVRGTGRAGRAARGQDRRERRGPDRGRFRRQGRRSRRQRRRRHLLTAARVKERR